MSDERHRRRWKLEEIHQLRDLMNAGRSWDRIAGLMNRTADEIRAKAKELKIPYAHEGPPQPMESTPEELRQRWTLLLPELKENLRRDLEK
jgi:hypothetical protein